MVSKRMNDEAMMVMKFTSQSSNSKTIYSATVSYFNGRGPSTVRIYVRPQYFAAYYKYEDMLGMMRWWYGGTDRRDKGIAP